MRSLPLSSSLLFLYTMNIYASLLSSMHTNFLFAFFFLTQNFPTPREFLNWSIEFIYDVMALQNM